MASDVKGHRWPRPWTSQLRLAPYMSRLGNNRRRRLAAIYWERSSLTVLSEVCGYSNDLTVRGSRQFFFASLSGKPALQALPRIYLIEPNLG